MPRRSPVADLARSIYLLWGHHPRPGRSGLTVSAIVQAGIELADAHGLAAVSMRKVADHLGAGAMSLYGYVPGKDDLTALMVDAVLAEPYEGDVEAATRAGDWREAMRFVARRNWELYLRHPWLLEVRSARPNLGPNASRKYEAEIRPLDGIGLSDIEMDTVLSLVLGHVADSARAHLAQQQDESGMSDAEWWAIVAPVLEQVMVDPDLVVSGRVGTAVGTAFNAASSPEHVFAFGLEVILDGVQARIDRA
ncbi:TetR/AcrR family transcriptional regulator [Prauserella oleivorans]|uniref:TetR/AcrR family transcriptional regulator n=1 Tax=Prauserella oleivorans TaxID=1478153 RepID=A0ABW5WEN9_9PSEU